MMTPEEKFNFARYIKTYIERRVELMTKNGIEQIENLVIRDDDTLTLNWQIGLTGAQLKVILSGELDPETAVKLMSLSNKGMPNADADIRLDKEPQ